MDCTAGITQLASTVMWTITGTMIVLMVLVQCNEVQRKCVDRDVDDAGKYKILLNCTAVCLYDSYDSYDSL